MNEPCHVHASDDGIKLCTYWIREDGSFIVADSVKIKAAERRKIEKAIVDHIDQIKEAYENKCKTNGLSPTTTVKRVNKSRQRPRFSELPTFTAVDVSYDFIWFTLSDGRKVAIPLAWSILLSATTVTQRGNFTVSAYNVFWDDVDEIIGVENVLFGKELYL